MIARATWVSRVLGVDVTGAETGANEDNDQASWESALAALEPRLRTALAGQVKNADELRAIRDYAEEKAQAGDYVAAMKSMATLQSRLELTEGPTAPSQAMVNKRKFLLERWQLIPGELEARLSALNTTIAARLPHEDSDTFCAEVGTWFGQIIDTFASEFDESVRDSITVGDTKYSAVAAVLNELRSRLAEDELLSFMKTSDLLDGGAIEAAFTGVIDEIETALSA
jgi:hypothetical protein